MVIYILMFILVGLCRLVMFLNGYVHCHIDNNFNLRKNNL
jgi:hypothetical protein